MSDLSDALKISAAGMKAQGIRTRVISENIANSDSMPTAPGLDPYRRKLVTFENTLDRELGIRTVKVKKINKDNSDFGQKHDPSNPVADGEGYVQTTNVNGMLEMMDMKQAQRSYEANLNAITISKTMLQRTIDLLR